MNSMNHPTKKPTTATTKEHSHQTSSKRSFVFSLLFFEVFQNFDTLGLTNNNNRRIIGWRWRLNRSRFLVLFQKLLNLMSVLIFQTQSGIYCKKKIQQNFCFRCAIHCQNDTHDLSNHGHHVGPSWWAIAFHQMLLFSAGPSIAPSSSDATAPSLHPPHSAIWYRVVHQIHTATLIGDCMPSPQELANLPLQFLCFLLPLPLYTLRNKIQSCKQKCKFLSFRRKKQINFCWSDFLCVKDIYANLRTI